MATVNVTSDHSTDLSEPLITATTNVNEVLHHQPGLRCVVVTPEREVLDRRADFVALPMFDGELGVLPGRQPLIGQLGFGELRLKQGDRVTARLFLDGGFAQVRANVVTVLTARASEAKDIDVPAAQAAVADNRAVETLSAAENEALTRARERARAQLRFVHAGTPGGEAAH
jgi:F-type H+-transporting ATPase subunit epsilon